MSFTWTVYVADDDTQYRVRVNTAWVTPPYNYWEVRSYAGKADLPRGMRMRRLTLKTADGQRRRSFPWQDNVGGDPFVPGRDIFLPNNQGSFTHWYVQGWQKQSFQPAKYRAHARRL